ncbi:MAG: hypothetical protein ACXWRA_14115 [Pseudobdellovibrionaceae bacterium]
MQNERANQLIEEVQQLTRQYHAEVSSTRKPWPKSIKDRVRELFTLDIHLKKTANQIDIPYETIMSWRFPKKKKPLSHFHALAVRKSPTVTVRKNNREISTSILTVTVRTPSGYIIKATPDLAAKLILSLERGG